MERLINVSNRLPITIGKTVKKSSGGLIAALEGMGEKYDLRWIGWTGGVISDADRQREIIRDLDENYNCSPIFLSRKEINGYYNNFSNSSLWPLLHYMTTYSRYDEEWFEIYRTVNQYFAEAVADQAQEEDIIWIHDYHLMLLPSLLRQKNRHFTIGYFLHTPFPSYEVFRCHPNREELLRGLLGADLIGFHTFGYLRHFRSTVLRVLGEESEMNYIAHENHLTRLGVYPIGINAAKFLQELQSPRYFRKLKEYQQVYRGKKVVLGVERLDYTKGIPRRMEAIERFLSSYPQRDNIVFILISVPSREDVSEYRNLLENIERKVSRINGKYSSIKNVPIHFINKSIDFSDLCTLYSLADVAIVTPLIDGMNLVAKEYLACQQENEGVLILSEFAGAAQELFNAIIVNPYNINQVAQSIHEALDLSGEEKKELIEPMRRRVLSHDARYWAETFIRDLAAGRQKEDGIRYDTQMIALDAIKPFVTADKIGLFLDYDGTLCEIKPQPRDAYPHAEIKEIFALLEQHQNIDVYLISGRKKEDMDRWFLIYPFTLIAEHGYYYRPAGRAEWQVLDEKTDLSWKEQIIDILRHYGEMTPGSSVEEKTSSVVWHYRRADPEFGSWKAHQLVGELYEMLSNLPVEIHHGKKIVEVSSTQVNKGRAVEHFIQRHDYDAVLCAGDDETDESMFRLSHAEIVSIKIGTGDTQAKYRVASPRKLRGYLKKALKRQRSVQSLREV
ncbi:MAG: hypothetical protein AMJ79_14515 [Phycisphaerae bacterium SM23_30]|nr:MAG: hypothetical protein AMJ79_14515 [Phycisphaerae bacterium SM23_30]